jgi:hypothetical protein
MLKSPEMMSSDGGKIRSDSRVANSEIKVGREEQGGRYRVKRVKE